MSGGAPVGAPPLIGVLGDVSERRGAVDAPAVT